MPKSTEPTPPQNLDAEESLLGALMLSTVVMTSVTDTDLVVADFYRPSHGLIYQACLTLYAKGEPTDPITVVAELSSTGKLEKAGGQERIHEIATLVPAASNAVHYANIIIEQALLRRLQFAGTAIRNSALDPDRPAADLVEQAEAAIFDLAQTRRRRADWVAMPEAVTDAHARILAAHEAGRAITGLASGFDKLDRMTSGFQPGNLVVLAARPSMGKTALALGAAAHAAIRDGVPVGMFTAEMSVSELTQRAISMLSFVDATDIRNGRLDGEGWERVNNAAEKLHAAPLFLDDASTSMIEIRAKARRLKLRQPELALLVVDYLQLLSFGGDGRYEGREKEVSSVSRALKALAGELELPVLALSQLSRQVEQRHDKRPILSDLRESGAIEQDADVVAFIYRDEYYNPEDTDQQGIAEVNIAKHRNGPTGTIKLAFVARHARFGDLAPE